MVSAKLIPAARTAIRTSPGPTGGSGRSCTCRTAGPPVLVSTTAFTPAAMHAAIYAISLAKESGADIDVLNVIPRNSVEHPESLESQVYQELDRIVPNQAREFCNPHTFVDVGNAHKRIEEHIRQYSVDLLVIGVRKSSHLDLEMRTSDAFGLIAASPCPVLTILG